MRNAHSTELCSAWYAFFVQGEPYTALSRNGDAIVCTRYIPDKAIQGTLVLIHGLGGYKEQEHLVSVARGAAQHGFQTIVCDAVDDITNGNDAVMRATPTRRIENLEDVVRSVTKEPWFQGVLLVGGHSLGGLAAGIVASRAEFQTKGAILLSPVVSGDMQWAARGVEVLKAWKKATFIDREFVTRPGEIFRLHADLALDARRYSLLQVADDLARQPVLLVVGSDDEATPPSQVQLAAFALGDSATYQEIPGTRHNFRGAETEVERIVSEWFKREYATL